MALFRPQRMRRIILLVQSNAMTWVVAVLMDVLQVTIVQVCTKHAQISKWSNQLVPSPVVSILELLRMLATQVLYPSLSWLSIST